MGSNNELDTSHVTLLTVNILKSCQPEDDSLMS
jgi:hypothetical protein